MSLFNTRKIPIMRPLQGAYVGGIWTETPEQTLYFKGTVQPSRPSDMKILPEARRVERAYTLYSRSQFKEGDRTAIDNEEYEILAVEVWQNGILPHYKAVATKRQREGSL